MNDLRFMQIACKREKAVVTHCANKASALAAIELQTFDMALLDYNLKGDPFGTGYQVFRAIKDMSAKTRCVFIVGDSSDLKAAKPNDSFQVIVKGDMMVSEVQRAIHADGTPAGAVMAFFLTCTSLLVGYLMGRPEILKQVLSSVGSLIK